MADLKTTNIYGDAYINNKVGIATNAPATRLQIGQLLPTAATEGIQFGDDTSARIYRDSSTVIKVSGGFSSTTFINAGNYLQTSGNLIYPASQTATQRLEVGNASGNAWIDGLTIAQGGNVTVYNNLTVNNAATVTNDLTVNGNTYLGNANNDTVYVNDTIRIGATDSGDASLFFGEGSVAGSDYGARWYWDSGYTFTWYTRNAGTDTSLFDYVTNDTTYLNWRRNFHMQNKSIDYTGQIHFNAGTRFVGQDTSILLFRSDSTSSGGIRVQNGSIATKGYTGYWDAGGGGILNDTGNWAVRYNFGSANSGGTLYGAWTVNGNISATNLSGTNTGDQSIGNGTITIAAGTGVGVGSSNTFTTNQSGATTVTITNTGVTALTTNTGLSTNASATGAVTITNTGVTNISAGTGIGTSASTGAVTITNNGVTSNVAGTGISVSGATGAVTITNSGVTSLAGTTNRITVSGATGAVTLNLPQDIHTGASPTFSGLSLTSVSTTGATITNLTGAYQNTTVYDSPRTQSATPSRGIRSPASSIQFTDSYAIAPFYTYRSTGDWPVPYGIGWGTGGESSGIFQRYASNGSSFGDMIFYTGNDGSGAFSFRRHTWEGTAYFAAGSGELNTELFRIDWAGKATATSFALPGGFTITDPGSGYAAFSNWVLLGTTGFYSSTNSAHLHPNTGTYGSWKITGTRGGWGGIEFESGVSLMVNSNQVGFHRNGYGWQLWWSAGTAYCHKGDPGGGTQATILDSSNFSSYALPINPDGDGVCVTYSDENPTFNGVSVGGGWYFGADGSTTGGGLTAKILNAFGGGVNSTNGYYVGNNNFLANSSTTTTTLCIDGSNNHFANELTISGQGMGAYNLMKYSGVRSGDWQTFTNTQGQLNVIEVQNIAGGSHSNYPTGVYTYGGVMSWRLASHSFQLYAAHTGDLAYKTQWGNDNYSGWRRILDSSTYPYAANMNQYVRTTDTCSFAALTVSNTINGSVTGNAGGSSTSCTGNAATATGQQSGVHFTLNTGGAGYGLVGQYNPDTHQGLFAMGAAYTLGAGGTLANFYGVSWSYDYSGRQLNTGYNLEHCMAISNAGVVRTVIGVGIWTNGLIRANGAISSAGTVTAAAFSGPLTGNVTGNVTGNTSGTAGSISGFNNPAVAATANTIVYRDGSGHIYGGYILGSYFNASAGNSENPTIGQIWTQNTTDNYLRKSTPAHFRSQVTDGSYPSLTGANASGTWSINITGNAGTATSATSATSAVSATYLNSSNYIARCGSSGNANTDFNNTPAGTIRHNGDDANLTNSPGATWWFYDNYRHSNSSNYWGIQVAWGWEDNANRLATRNVTGGSFGGWVYYLNSANYNSYSPTLTGTGASGTWSINVTGNAGGSAASCTGNAATATTTDNINGRAFYNRDSGNALGQDSYTNNGVGYVNAVSLFSQTDGGMYASAYSTSWVHQIYGDFRTGQIAIRGKNSGTWQAWRSVLDSSNYTSYAPTLTGTGASGTWAINITGNAATATTATNVTIANGSVTLAKIENITAYTILGNSNASSAATPAALAVGTVATMLSGQTMNINGSSTSCSGNAATATVNSGNASAGWYPIVWHSGNTHYSSTGTIIYAAGNYIQATYFNSSDNDETTITRFVIKNGDGYHRSATTTAAADIIRGVASGTWSITAATANALTTGNTYQVANLGIGVAASNRLHINGDGVNPTIRIDNTVFGTGSSSSRVFFGWLPISINVFGTVTTKYIQLYNS